jgi:hypothetical protein
MSVNTPILRRCSENLTKVTDSSRRTDMTARRTRRSKSLIGMATELAFAVPLVVGHRLTRLAIAGPSPSARDKTEFRRMCSEKATAFNKSWNAMGLAAMRSFWSPTLLMSKPAAAQMRNATLGILGKGMAPVHRTAVANARRLARTRLK